MGCNSGNIYTNSFSAASVALNSGSSKCLGGLFGFDQDQPALINTYWDVNRSGRLYYSTRTVSSDCDTNETCASGTNCKGVNTIANPNPNYFFTKPALQAALNSPASIAPFLSTSASANFAM